MFLHVCPWMYLENIFYESMSGVNELANIKSAIKRVKLSQKRSELNTVFKSGARTAVKKADEALNNNDKENAEQLVRTAAKKLDKSVSKGLLHKNNAARQKSRLMRHLNELQAK